MVTTTSYRTVSQFFTRNPADREGGAPVRCAKDLEVAEWNAASDGCTGEIIGGGVLGAVVGAVAGGVIGAQIRKGPEGG